MNRGEKISATKLYRDRTGANLMESKQAVELLAARHGITIEGAGCSGVTVILVLAVVAIAVAAVLMILGQ